MTRDRLAFGLYDEDPCFVSGLEAVSIVLTSILADLETIELGGEMDEEKASRLFVACHALEGEIRYLENLLLWTKLTWKHDPTILAEFVSEGKDEETQRAIDMVRTRQAEIAAVRARMAGATEHPNNGISSHSLGS